MTETHDHTPTTRESARRVILAALVEDFTSLSQSTTSSQAEAVLDALDNAGLFAHNPAMPYHLPQRESDPTVWRAGGGMNELFVSTGGHRRGVVVLNNADDFLARMEPAQARELVAALDTAATKAESDIADDAETDAEIDANTNDGHRDGAALVSAVAEYLRESGTDWGKDAAAQVENRSEDVGSFIDELMHDNGVTAAIIREVIARDMKRIFVGEA